MIAVEQRAFRRTAVAAAVLLATFLSGCSDQGEDYCTALSDEQKTLTDLAQSATKGGDVLTPTLESFERLRAAAPEELQDEWETVVVAYQALADAVEDAGIDPADYDPEKPPPGVSAQDADRLAAVANKLAAPRVGEAVAGIEQHADEVCGVKFTT